MSDVHLKDIRQCLEKLHWRVVEELEGDDHGTSGVWLVARPVGVARFHLDFEGLDDLETFPIDKTYGCEVREAPHVACYFSRQGRSWPAELAAFEQKLKAWGTR